MLLGFQGTPIAAGQALALPTNEKILPQVNTIIYIKCIIYIFYFYYIIRFNRVIVTY